MNATKFVIKGFWDEEPVYFQKIDGMAFENIPAVKLTTSIVEATLFNSIEEAEKQMDNVSNKIFKIYPVCPNCGEDYDGHPAISRKDNKTKICSNCGISEAFIAFMDSQNPKNNDFGEKIITFLETQKKLPIKVVFFIDVLLNS